MHAPHLGAFLDSYEAGPGYIAPEQAPCLIDLTTAADRMQAADAPFAHGTIDGFLPDSLYHAVLRDWPAESCLASVALPGSDEPGSGYVGSRRTKLLEEWGSGTSASQGTEAWAQISLALRSPAFVRNLFTRFSDVIDANLGVLAAEPPGKPGFKLYLNRDQGAEEALGAHVDALRKLLTIVIYVDLAGALNDESEHLWGTALYDAEPGSVEPVRFSSNAGHHIAHRIDFAANRAFVMPNDSRALHGVAGGQAGVARRTLMCGYWLLSRE